MTITRGSTYYKKFRIKDNGHYWQGDMAEKVEFAFADSESYENVLFTKTYPSENVEYDKETNVFTIYLTEQETFACQNMLYIQAKAYWLTGERSQSNIKYDLVNPTLFKVVKAK